MAIYPPPKYIPINKVFNKDEFINDDDTGITEYEASLLFVKNMVPIQ